MKIATPFLLSLCALTLLSACAKDDNRNVALDPVVNPEDDINLPDERGPNRPMIIRMIRAGLRESNEARQRRGLAPLAYDQNLTAIAQRRAREIRNGNGGNGSWQDSQQMPAGPDGMPGSGNRGHDDRDGRGNDRDGRDGRGDGRDGRDGRDRDDRGNDHRIPGQPGFEYAAENSLSGLRSPEQAYVYFSRTPSTRIHLFSNMYRRHGIGYSDGTWVEVFAY